MSKYCIKHDKHEAQVLLVILDYNFVPDLTHTCELNIYKNNTAVQSDPDLST